MADAPRPVEEFPYRYEVVPLDRLFVDKEYQRPLTSFVDEIAENWRPSHVGVLAVSERSRGRDFTVRRGAVFDGQTRFEAARIRTKMREARLIRALPCLVYEGLTREEEALLFVELQEARRNVTSYEKFRALLTVGAKHPRGQEALDIQALVHRAGYEIGDQRSQHITSVAALRTGFRRDSLTLERALIIYRSAWKDRWIPTAWCIRGMVKFLLDNIDNGRFDDERLIRRLFITPMGELERKAISAREVAGSARGEIHMAQALGGLYGMPDSAVAKKMEKLES